MQVHVCIDDNWWRRTLDGTPIACCLEMVTRHASIRFECLANLRQRFILWLVYGWWHLPSGFFFCICFHFKIIKSYRVISSPHGALEKENGNSQWWMRSIPLCANGTPHTRQKKGNKQNKWSAATTLTPASGSQNKNKIQNNKPIQSTADSFEYTYTRTHPTMRLLVNHDKSRKTTTQHQSYAQKTLQSCTHLLISTLLLFVVCVCLCVCGQQ